MVLIAPVEFVVLLARLIGSGANAQPAILVPFGRLVFAERAALGDEVALCELCKKMFNKCPASGTQMMELGTCRGALLHVCKKYVSSGGENIKKRRGV